MKSGKVEVRVMMPKKLHDALSAEADETAVTMADLVRLAVADRYRSRAKRVMVARMGKRGWVTDVSSDAYDLVEEGDGA